MSLQNISADFITGRDVHLAEFINLYGCCIGDFVEIQRNREKLQDIKPLVYLRRRYY